MQIHSYQKAREYLESFIRPSMSARVEIEPGIPHPLRRMECLLELLDNPQEKFRSIQVSGTAGKGSTAYLVSRILTTAGYKTGLTLSPHLQKLTERVQITNQEISDMEFISLLNQLVPVIEKMKNMPLGEPTYFEILIAMAFTHFAEQQVDIAIVEVGLEGRLDGTNTLSPLLAVLTNIDLDHTEILGETVEEIAIEAASIIKKWQVPSQGRLPIVKGKENNYSSTEAKCPCGTKRNGEVPEVSSRLGSNNNVPFVITGVKQESVLEIIREKCTQEEAMLSVLGKDFQYETRDVNSSGSHFDFISSEKTYKDLHLALLGAYQIENATIAIETILQLKKFDINVSEAHLRQALATAKFQGRFEICNYTLGSKRYTLILDGAHNPIKMRAFLKSLESLYPQTRKIFVTTFKKGKQIEEMLNDITDTADVLILTEFHRTIDTGKNASMKSSELVESATIAQVKSISVYTTATSDEAMQIAFEQADESTMIIVTGSLYLVGEVREGLALRNFERVKS